MACGCFLLLGLIAGLVFAIMHGLWLIAAGAIAVTALVTWLCVKAMQKS